MEQVINAVDYSTWDFNLKRFPDGLKNKFKAYFCYCGSQELEGVDFFGIYPPFCNQLPFIECRFSKCYLNWSQNSAMLWVYLYIPMWKRVNIFCWNYQWIPKERIFKLLNLCIVFDKVLVLFGNISPINWISVVWINIILIH